jgi:transcriptional regulator with XRE-family HTH domain
MNWEEYKDHVKQVDPVASDIIEESEAEASIISALINRRVALGLSQRDLAALCNIPQSSVARIESNRITPRLDTILKLLKELGLTLSVTKLSAGK